MVFKVVKRVSVLTRIIKTINYPLLIGGCVFICVLIACVLGPRLAPQDPLKENYALRVNGNIRQPPYVPFAVDGFPLGTDQYGRDLLSRLLWAVRPTMLMVTLVALIRLLIGMVIGLISGWFPGLIGKWTEGIISLGVSIPVLIIALIGITAIGINKGVYAFIFGLSITGWAETARIINEQTKYVKSQVFIEAARSLGASDTRILLIHVIRQIMPIVWMLFAFEISATLVVIAELGFLGYYLGGGAWIEVSDFVAINVEGIPELGQMLASGLDKLSNPHALISISGVIFIMIMGFNLIGEGLRLQTNLGRKRSGKWQKLFGDKVGDWVELSFMPDARDWVINHLIVITLILTALIVFFGMNKFINSEQPVTNQSTIEVLGVPGDHIWASERQNSRGTKWTPVSGPSNPEILWFVSIDGEPSGGPVIDKFGTAYIATKTRELLAIDKNGCMLWKSDIADEPVGTPALGERGEIYVADKSGSLTAYSPDGGLLWRMTEKRGREALSSPIVSSNGSILYNRLDVIQAVDLFGKPIWLSPSVDVYTNQIPILSPQESFVFLKDLALATDNGIPLKLEGIPFGEAEFSDPVFFVGADNKTYIRTGSDAYAWRSTLTGIEVDEPLGWDYQQFSTPILPTDQGVTPDGILWYFYSWDYTDVRLVSINSSSRVISNLRYAERGGYLIGIDQNSIAYICSHNFGYAGNCHAIRLGSDEDVWNIHLGDNAFIVGGAIASNRLYISLGAGYLVVLGDN